MKTRMQWTGLVLALLLPATRLLPAQPGSADSPGDVAVVVNQANPVDAISSIELRKIFAGEKQNWSGSLPVFVLVRAPQARERDIMLAQILHMNESDYKAHWVRKIYSGEVQREPLVLLSNGMQLEAVRAEKGGIALIKLSDVRQGVKVLKIDGHLPGSDGYALR